MDYFILIIIIHYLADFSLQTNEQALRKSEGNALYNKWLFYHVAVYSTVWLLVTIGLKENILWSVAFALITFTFHYATDWHTSRLGKVFWDSGDKHNGFSVIGGDQVLHYFQLYYTFRILDSVENNNFALYCIMLGFALLIGVVTGLSLNKKEK